MEYYGEIILETQGRVMSFDIDYALCTLSGSHPTTLTIDLETVKQIVAIEEDFIRTVRAAVYITKNYETTCSLQYCVDRFDSASGECVFSFLDHEELYAVVFEKMQIMEGLVYIEMTGKTIDVVSTKRGDFTTVIVRTKAAFKSDL